MKTLSEERCFICDAATGKAGAGDGSIYDDCRGDGPYCEDCFCEHLDSCRECASEEGVK